GRNVTTLRTATDYRLASTYTDGWAVTGLRVGRGTVYFLKLGIINVLAKRFGDTSQVSDVTIRCELNTVCKSAFQITHKVIGGACIAISNKPARNEFCIRVNGNPRPYIPAAFQS